MANLDERREALSERCLQLRLELEGVIHELTTPEDRAYLDQLEELGNHTIHDSAHEEDDFEIDTLTGLHEISVGSAGIWVRGWIFVCNDQLVRAGLLEATEEDGDEHVDEEADDTEESTT